MAQLQLPLLQVLVLWILVSPCHGLGSLYGSSWRATALRGGGSAASSQNKTQSENSTVSLQSSLTRSYYDDDFVSDSDEGDIYSEADEYSESDGPSTNELTSNFGICSQGAWSQDAYARSKHAAGGDSATLVGRTAIVVHGCHLAAVGWERLVWGDSGQQMVGRLAHAALLTAHDPKVSLVVCGTGGSTRGGISEGAYTKQYLLRNLPRLRSFPASDGIDLESLSRRLEHITVAECESRNTVEELAAAFDLAEKAGCTRIVLVSSPSHLPRCLRDARALIHQRRRSRGARCASALDASSGRGEASCSDAAAKELESDTKESEERQGSDWVPLELLASPSETCYDGSVPSDVVVLEPAHRGDRDTRLDGPLSLAKLMQRSLKLTPPPSLRKMPPSFLASGLKPLSSMPSLSITSSVPDTAAAVSAASGVADMVTTLTTAPGVADYKLAFAQDLNALLSRYELDDVESVESTQMKEVDTDKSADVAEKPIVPPGVHETEPTILPTQPLLLSPPSSLPSPPPPLVPPAPTPSFPGHPPLRGPGDALALALHQALLRRSRAHHRRQQRHQLQPHFEEERKDSDAINACKTKRSNLAQKWRDIVPMSHTTPPQGYVPLPGFAPPLTVVDLPETVAPLGGADTEGSMDNNTSSLGVTVEWPHLGLRWQRTSSSCQGDSDNVNDGRCRFAYRSAELRGALGASPLRLDTRLEKRIESCPSSACTLCKISAPTNEAKSVNLKAAKSHDDQATPSSATETHGTECAWMVATLDSDLRLKLDLESFVSFSEDHMKEASSSGDTDVNGANEAQWRVNTKALDEVLAEAFSENTNDASTNDSGDISMHATSEEIADEDKTTSLDNPMDTAGERTPRLLDDSKRTIDFASEEAKSISTEDTLANLVVEDNSANLNKDCAADFSTNMPHSGKLNDVVATLPNIEVDNDVDDVLEGSKEVVELATVPANIIESQVAPEPLAAAGAVTELFKPSVDSGKGSSTGEVEEAAKLQLPESNSSKSVYTDVPEFAFGASTGPSDSLKPTATETEVTEAPGQPLMRKKNLPDGEGNDSVAEESQANPDSKLRSCRRRRWWRLWLF